MNCVIKGQFYKRDITSWSFSYDSFVKFHGKKIGGHNMTGLHPNLCYNDITEKLLTGT